MAYSSNASFIVAVGHRSQPLPLTTARVQRDLVKVTRVLRPRLDYKGA